MTEKIETLWQEMADELRSKDTMRHPQKKIVMTSPWKLAVHALDERETQLDFFRETPVDKEDFDESSLPPELLALVKANKSASIYPNIVEAEVSGETLEEAIEKMRLKLRLLDYGYILLDWEHYQDDYLSGDDDGDDDDEIDIDDIDFEGIDDDDFEEI
ncbi:MAG: hypothetical protein J6S98_04590 [Lentisphaeria bacterium]|nr:hypothetical protein [Lentisphaeria bacterium]